MSQIKRSRFSQSVDLILKLNDEFDGLKEQRKKASIAFIHNRKAPTNDIEDILDFFDMIGLIIAATHSGPRNGMAHLLPLGSSLFDLSKDYILDKQKEKEMIWTDFVILENKLVEMELKRAKHKPELELSEEDLKQFLEDESTL